MALTPKLANLGANTAADATCALVNGGTVKLYTGSQPADADAGIGGATLLATLTFGSPAFGAAVAGVATANAITGDSSADNSGTAAWFRALTSGAAAVWDGAIGVTGGGFDIELNTTTVVAGASVNVTAFTYTQRKT